MSTCKVIFLLHRHWHIHTYVVDGETEVQGTCPNSQYGWVEASASQMPDLTQQVYGPPLSSAGTAHPDQAQGDFPPGPPSTGSIHPCRDSAGHRGVLQPGWGWGTQVGLRQEFPTHAEMVGLYEEGKGQWYQLSSLLAGCCPVFGCWASVRCGPTGLEGNVYWRNPRGSV